MCSVRSRTHTQTDIAHINTKPLFDRGIQHELHYYVFVVRISVVVFFFECCFPLTCIKFKTHKRLVRKISLPVLWPI